MATIVSVLTDFAVMAENEIQGIRTGKSKGPRMRDCVGQWEATVKEAKQILSAIAAGEIDIS